MLFRSQRHHRVRLTHQQQIGGRELLVIHAGAAMHVRPFPVFGNASMSAPAENGGSIPRLYELTSSGMNFLARQYFSNNLYFYPSHQDHNPGWNGVGGGTILFGAHMPRFHPSDFRVNSLDGVADDWPIDYTTLEPYFAENDRMMPQTVPNNPTKGAVAPTDARNTIQRSSRSISRCTVTVIARSPRS